MERAAITEGFMKFSDRNSVLAKALEDICIIQNLKIGDVIIEQGMPSKFVYTLLYGEAEVVLTSRTGQEHWLEYIEAGNIFGELCILLSFEDSNACVTAVSKVCVARMTGAQFEALLETSPAFSRKVLTTQCARVVETCKRMVEGNDLPIAARVHAELLRLAIISEVDNNLYIISPPLSVSSLAKRVNASRESVSRAISAYEKTGVIKRKTDKWTVLKLK